MGEARDRVAVRIMHEVVLVLDGHHGQTCFTLLAAMTAAAWTVCKDAVFYPCR